MEFVDILDIAAQRLTDGQSLPSILADFPAEADRLGPMLNIAVSLNQAFPVEMPTPDQLQADRQAFLAQVQFLQQQPVSAPPLVRLKNWIVDTFSWPTFKLASQLSFQRKDQARMSSLLLKVMLIFGVVMGLTGGTAVMAANSLPDSPVYPLKLSMEQARLALTADPAGQATLHLEMAQVRAQEMMQLARRGATPDEAAQTRLRDHVNTALQVAARLNDTQMQDVLTQTRAMVRTQLQQLTQTQAQVGEPAQAALQQASQFLNRVGQDVAAGLEDPLTFRNRYGHNRPADAPDPSAPEPERNRQVGPPEEPPAAGPGPNENPNCPGDTCEPAGDQNQNQNQYRHSQGDELPAGPPRQNRYRQEADDASGSTPQNQDCPDCVPAGDENKYGQGGGPHGDQDCTDCMPAGDENKYGQGGGPHGDQDCTDCVPDGDKNQNQAGKEADAPDAPQGNQNGSSDESAPVQNQEQNQVQQQEQQAEPQQPEPNPAPAPDNGGDSGGSGDSGSGGGGDSGGGSSSGGSSGGGGDSGGSSSGGGSDSNGGGGKK